MPLPGKWEPTKDLNVMANKRLAIEDNSEEVDRQRGSHGSSAGGLPPYQIQAERPATAIIAREVKFLGFKRGDIH